MSVANNFSVSISYPPLSSPRGQAFLSQNRQFQWTHTGNVIYPVIPASAATLLQKNNFCVFWDDAIAEKLTYSQWLARLANRRPDLVAIETKTPVIKTHWKIINELKTKLPNTIIVLFGDHVTALPDESLRNSRVDHILIGGDYDLLLLDLVIRLSKNLNPPKIVKKKPYPNLKQLPPIDRQLTRWQLYSHRNSNFKYTPGAYTMFSRDCWWGKCTFCSWATLYPGNSYRCTSVASAINEVEHLIDLGVKEIFDDSGTFPVGEWLEEFCRKIIIKKLNNRIRISCNMRFGVLNQKQYCLMARAGFRMLLYGFESANQKTLDLINKNNKTENAPKDLQMAKGAGLSPHLTAMIGYPWETVVDANLTLKTARDFFRHGLADSLQATIVIPYPGTPLFKYCQENNLLLTTDWGKYDMSQPVIRSPLSPEKQKELINGLFRGIITPRFILNQLISIRSLTDLKHLFKYSLKYFQKLHDFS